MSKADAKKKKQAKEAEVNTLLLELSDLGIDEHDKRLDICNQVLKLAPNDKDVLQIKVINLINLSRQYDAEKVLTEANLQSDFPFEYAYTLYRQNKVAQAREALDSIKGAHANDEGVLHLRAQLDQKDEKNESAAQIYRTFLDNSMEDPDPEVMCNFLACSPSCDEKTMNEAKELAKEHQHWETYFNVVCCLIEEENWKEAWTTLNDCTELCKDLAKELEWSDKQLQDELCIITVQKAYVMYRLGNVSKSKELLDGVLKEKPSSVQASAVAEINWVALNEDKSLFDSYKKIKHASSQAIDSKLTSKQRLAVRHSNAALLLRMGKSDACRTACDALMQQYPASDIGPLLVASLLFRERKFAKAEDTLKAYIKTHIGTDLPLRAQLTLAQMQLLQGQVAAAIQTLSQVHSVEQKLGVLAFLVKLYSQTNQVDPAIKLLDSAIDFLGKSPPSPATKSKMLTLLSKSAEFKLKEKQYKEAAETYKRGLQLNANDTVLMSGLVLALAEFDPESAEQYLTKLPSSVDQGRLNELLQDREALEEIPVPRDNSKYLKKRKTTTDSGMELDEPKKAKAKKKRKVRHPPKVMDGKPDPERWIRLKDRSYYKKPTKKQKSKSSKKR